MTLAPAAGDVVRYTAQTIHDQKAGVTYASDFRVGTYTGRKDRRGRLIVAHGGKLVDAWHVKVYPDRVTEILSPKETT